MINMGRGIALLLLLGTSVSAATGQGYKITGSIPIGGTGHWDYLIVDPENRRLYVSHNSEVVVINVDTQEVVGKITVDGFSHGIALANDLNLGFITDGDSKTSEVKSPEQVVTFDLKTFVEQPQRRWVTIRMRSFTTRLPAASLLSMEIPCKPTSSPRRRAKWTR